MHKTAGDSKSTLLTPTEGWSKAKPQKEQEANESYL